MPTEEHTAQQYCLLPDLPRLSPMPLSLLKPQPGKPIPSPAAFTYNKPPLKSQEKAAASHAILQDLLFRGLETRNGEGVVSRREPRKVSLFVLFFFSTPELVKYVNWQQIKSSEILQL